MKASAVCACALVAAVSSALSAQVPLGADTLSAKSVAESLAVLKTLEGAVRASPKDASGWYHRGMIAWALADRAKAKPANGSLDSRSLERVADSSLALAASLEQTNPRYLLASGMYLRTSTTAATRAGATGLLTKAVAAARAGPDQALHAATAVAAGRAAWLDYDSRAYRRNYACSPPTDCAEHANLNGMKDKIDPSKMASDGGTCPNGMPSSIDSATTRGDGDPLTTVTIPTLLALKELHNRLLDCTSPLPDAGSAEYANAEALFREAATAAPNDPRIFRQLAMLLAEKGRWSELGAVAHDYLSRNANDPWGWLVLGLALQRSGQSDVAVAAFDTGTARLDAHERARLFAFTRVLGSRDSASYANAPSVARDNTERSFWAMAAPLWSRKGNDPRTEFLSRVTFAELRWTVEELGVRGADSDRGAMHIRYGPPDKIAMLRGMDFLGTKSPPIGGHAMAPASDVITFWDYDTGLSLVFWGPPLYGTAHFPVSDGAHIEDIIAARPVSFDNVSAGHIEEIPLAIARFRAAADSVDLLLVSQSPVADIRGAAANAPVHENAWLFGRDVPNAYRDTTTLDDSGIKARTYRVPPSAYMYRVEATADAAMTSARATIWITAARDSATGFTTRGFGISDLLLATVANPRGTPARWRDFDMAPLVGALPKKSDLDLIWENYELGQRSGQAQYHVTLTIQRERSAAGKFAALIIGALSSAVKVDRRDDRIIQQFDRNVPFAATVVDHVTIGLGDTPSGTYRMTLEINDVVSGRKTSRTTELTVSAK